MRFEVLGPPIAGEDRRERGWREAIAAAVPPSARGHRGVVLAFRLEPGRRRIDVDNLARPALDALRDAGAFQRGFPDLDALLAVKGAGVPMGLTVILTGADDVGRAVPPGPLVASVSAPALPRDGDAVAKRVWRGVVADGWGAQPLDGEVAVDVRVRTPTSLKDLLKPILDGLEAVLGRDPSGHLEFSPNDHRVTWLRITRTPRGPALEVDVIGRVSGRGGRGPGRWR